MATRRAGKAPGNSAGSRNGPADRGKSDSAPSDAEIGGRDLGESEELIAAFFQSQFGLSFDGGPFWFTPNWEYRPGVAAAGGYRLIHEDLCRNTADKRRKGEGGLEGTDPPGPVFPPGRIPRGRAGLAARRLDVSLLARLYQATAVAEYMVFPLYVAHEPADRDRQAKRIAHVIGLDHAALVGLITGYAICWPAGRYPKVARSVRLFVPGGHRQRARVLGGMEAPLRAWVEAMKAESGLK